MKVKSFQEYLNKKKLTEELHVDGLTYLGTGYGVELYEATTWEGAQALVADNDNEPAGASWANSEDVFNREIVNGNTRLYFFVRANSNRVLMGVISRTGLGNVSCKDKTIQMNYQLQNLDGNNSTSPGAHLPDNLIFPLYLLPDLEYNGEDGVCYSTGNTEILCSYNGFINPNEVPDIFNIPQAINRIYSYAFDHYQVPSVHIPENVRIVDINAFNGYSGIIEIDAESPEAEQINGWSSQWNNNATGEIIWGTNLAPEERVERQREREEARRQEQERIEAEQRAEQERIRREQELQTADAANVLRYKENKDGITILGCKKGRKKLIIPDEINGKPVVSIAPFAFYKNDWLTDIRVPDSVKTIGKGAFANLRHTVISYPKTATLFSDVFLGDYKATKRI